MATRDGFSDPDMQKLYDLIFRHLEELEQGLGARLDNQDQMLRGLETRLTRLESQISLLRH